MGWSVRGSADAGALETRQRASVSEAISPGVISTDASEIGGPRRRVRNASSQDVAHVRITACVRWHGASGVNIAARCGTVSLDSYTQFRRKSTDARSRKLQILLGKVEGGVGVGGNLRCWENRRATGESEAAF